MVEQDDPLWTSKQIAQYMGWARPNTWRGLVAQGKAPRPDDPDDDRGVSPSRRNPRWRRSTIVAYKAARPGRGKGGGRRPKGAVPAE